MKSSARSASDPARWWLFALLLCLLTCSCEAPGTFYTVAIDPNLSAQDQQAIRQSIVDWRLFMDGKLTIYEHPGPCVGAGYEACFWASDLAHTDTLIGIHDPLAVTTLYTQDQHADVYVAVDEDGAWSTATATQTMTHELGHAMALQHTQPETVMCWTESCANPGLTCDDAAQWLYIRGRSDTDTLPQCPAGGTFAWSGK